MNRVLPKQFLLLNGRPILFYTLERFFAVNTSFRLNLVLPVSHVETWNELISRFNFQIPHTVIEGGQTRFHSVKQGLERVKDGLVGVHDGVRPLVSSETITRCFNLANETGSGIPVIPVTDSVRILNDGHSESIDRNFVRFVQTPQCFRSDLLKKAYDQPYNELFTDCASVVESMKVKVFLTEGNPENIKITRPIDLMLAELQLKHIR